MDSMLKILEYVRKVSKVPITCNGEVLETPKKIVLHPDFYKKDGCNCCSNCCQGFFNTVYTDSGIEWVKNCPDSEFSNPEMYGDHPIPLENRKILLDSIVEHEFMINGKVVKMYESPCLTGSQANKIDLPHKPGAGPRCRWVMTDVPGLFRCGIHPIRSVTCGLPHLRIDFSSGTSTTTLAVRQFGRNWALGCSVDLKDSPNDLKSVKMRIHWLKVLKSCADDLGIPTVLPEIINYVENLYPEMEKGNFPKDHIVFDNLGAIRKESTQSKPQIRGIFFKGAVKLHTENKVPENQRGFQLYFAGSYHKEFDPYLRTHGGNRLGSQLTERPMIEEWSKENRPGFLFVDSGAYSAHSRGKEIDVDEYIDYLNSVDDSLHIFAQVDHIPGKLNQPKTPEELAEAPKLSWDNYLYMVKKLKSPKKLLPVFHQGEDFKWLVNMLEWVDEKGEHIPYIGISPANDSPVKEKIKFIDSCFSIIRNSSNPCVQTHAFGMTSLYVLERYPFTSADSTSWLMNGANGSIMTHYGSVLLSDQSSHLPGHISKMVPRAREAIRQYVEKRGYHLETLGSDYRERIKFNIDYLLEWARNYVYVPKTVYRRYIFWEEMFENE